MAGFNLFNFENIPWTSVQKIGTGATMPSYQSTTQQTQQTQQPMQLQQSSQPTTLHLFSDEVQAKQKMLSSGLSEPQADNLIKKRRQDLLGNTKLTPQEAQWLLKMQADNLDTKTAVDLLQKKREADYGKKGIGEKAFIGATGLATGALTTAGKTTLNFLDFIAKPLTGYTGFGDEAKQYEQAQKVSEWTVWQGTASKVGSFIEWAGMMAAAPAPSIGWTGIGGAVLRWTAYGGAYWALDPIAQKWSEATAWEVAGWSIVWGLTGAVAWPVIGKAVEKGAKYGTALVKWGIEWLGKSIGRDVSKPISSVWDVATRSIPKKVVSGDLWFTPTERAKIEKITGNDEATYVLSKWLAGKGKEDMAQVFQKQADDMYNWITNKLANVDKTVKSPVAQSALEDIVNQLESSPKLKNAYAKDIAWAKAMLEKWDYTLSDINNIRRAYDKVNTGMFTTQWVMKSGIENAVDVKIREWLSNQLQKEAKLVGIDVKWMNNDLRAGLVMKDALLRRLSQEERNNFINLQDLGVSAILSGGNPVTAVATMAAKKYGEKMAPSVAQKLYNLSDKANVPRTVTRGNTISPSSKSSLLNLAGSNRNTVASEQVTPTIPSWKGKGINPFDLSKNKKWMINPSEIWKSVGIGKKVPDELKEFSYKPPKKLYRWVSENIDKSKRTELWFASLWKWLYSTRDKSFAAKYGKVVELDPKTAFPKNPLVIERPFWPAPWALKDWLLNKTWLRNISEFHKKYWEDYSIYLKSLWYDGAVIWDEVVKY